MARPITSISQEWRGTVHIAPVLKQKCHLSSRLHAPLKQFTELLYQWHLHIYCFLLYSRTDFQLVSLKCQYFKRKKSPLKLKKRVIRIDLYIFTSSCCDTTLFLSLFSRAVLNGLKLLQPHSKLYIQIHVFIKPLLLHSCRERWGYSLIFLYFWKELGLDVNLSGCIGGFQSCAISSSSGFGSKHLFKDR